MMSLLMLWLGVSYLFCLFRLRHSIQLNTLMLSQHLMLSLCLLACRALHMHASLYWPSGGLSGCSCCIGG